MDAVQLQYFKAVCETGSYSRAAEQLYISPQGISKAIHKLEDELGAPLFTLTQSGLAVTDYGQLLRSRADEYLCQHHRMLNEIRQLREASDNVLTIGIRAGFSEGIGKNFLLNFILANPDLVVRVRSFAHDRMEEGMRQPDIPVWVAPGGYDESRFTPLYEHIEKLFLLVSEDHPLARKEAVRVEDLDGYPLALPARYANRQACYTTVYLISNIDLRDQYKNVQENEPATWKAFLRRIHHVIEYHQDKPPTDHGSALDYIFPPPKPVPDWVKEIEDEETPPEQFGLPF